MNHQTSISEVPLLVMSSSSAECGYGDTSCESFDLQLNTSSESCDRHYQFDPKRNYKDNNIAVQYCIQQPKSNEAQLESVAALKKLISQQRKTITMLKAKYRSSQKQLAHLSKYSERSDTLTTESLLSCERDDTIISEEMSLEECDSIKEQATHCFGSSVEDKLCVRDDDEQISLTREDSDQSEVDIALLPISLGVLQAETRIKSEELRSKVSEIEQLQSEIKSHRDELDRLKSSFREKGRELARVELERDLIEAEAQRAQDELNVCRAELGQLRRELSVSPSAIIKSEKENNSIDESTVDESSRENKLQVVQLSRSGRIINTSFDASENKCTDDKVLYFSADFSQCEQVMQHEDNSIYREGSIRIPGRLQSAQNLRENAHNIEKPNQSAPKKDKQVLLDDDTPLKRGRRLLFFGKRKQSNEYSPMTDGSGIKRDRAAEKQQKVIASLQTEVDDLSSRLRESRSTVEEFRKRLNLVNRYYDSVVTSLKNKVVNLTSEKTEVEIDMLNQLVLLEQEKNTTIKKLREEINAKEMKMRLLKHNSDMPLWHEKIQVGAFSDASSEESLHEDSDLTRFTYFAKRGNLTPS